MCSRLWASTIDVIRRLTARRSSQLTDNFSGNTAPATRETAQTCHMSAEDSAATFHAEQHTPLAPSLQLVAYAVQCCQPALPQISRASAVSIPLQLGFRVSQELASARPTESNAASCPVKIVQEPAAKAAHREHPPMTPRALSNPQSR